MRARACALRKTLKRLLHILDNQHWSRASQGASVPLINDCRRRAAVKGGAHKIMAITRLALYREKQVAWLQGARIDRNASYFTRKAATDACAQRAD